MKLEISIRVKIEKTEDLHRRISLLMDYFKRDLWGVFENIMELENEPPVTVTWSEVEDDNDDPAGWVDW